MNRETRNNNPLNIRRSGEDELPIGKTFTIENCVFLHILTKLIVLSVRIRTGNVRIRTLFHTPYFRFSTNNQ